MSLTELLKDIVQTGPANLKKFLELAEKLPSDQTLKQFNTTLSSLIPYIPQLEKLLGDGNIKNLEKLLKRIPDSQSLDRLVGALPLLEKMPDKVTLNRLIDKADSLKGFLDSLEGNKS